jgi:hypothetical protein
MPRIQPMASLLSLYICCHAVEGDTVRQIRDAEMATSNRIHALSYVMRSPCRSCGILEERCWTMINTIYNIRKQDESLKSFIRRCVGNLKSCNPSCEIIVDNKSRRARNETGVISLNIVTCFGKLCTLPQV